MPNSQNSSLRSLQSDGISVYSVGKMTQKCELDCIKSLNQSFPQLPIEFYDTLHDRLIENGFTDARLKDAVGNLIDTCVYPQPTIANIISWDKVIKRYSYNEMCDMIALHGAAVWKRYGSLKTLGNRVYWINLVEAEQYGIEVKKM